MNKCLIITLVLVHEKNELYNFVQKEAEKHNLEGIMQRAADSRVRITVCGAVGQVEDFIDILHEHSKKYEIDEIEIEPILKGKDYRGVFRVIE